MSCVEFAARLGLLFVYVFAAVFANVTIVELQQNTTLLSLPVFHNIVILPFS